MKKIIIVMALVFSLFLFLGCPIGCGDSYYYLLAYKINKKEVSTNEKIELNITFGQDYSENNPLLIYIKNIPIETVEILTGEKVNYDSKNSTLYIKMGNFDYYKSTLSFSFEKAGKYKISFGVFFIDENGNVKEEYPVEKKITITVTE